MQTRIDEIAAGIYRLSVYVPDIAPPVGFTFNHFLVRADEPMLFHCGLRAMFPPCPKRSAGSSRSRRCAGSASVTSRPTNAAR
jgi:hypothetical protein